MRKIAQVQGRAIPLAMDNVDTDLIIPAQYLTSVSKAGYGEHLFCRLRESDPDFVFNQAKYKGANILIARNNFGCGSSREHAVWALQQVGIQAIIAVSFADIFSDNCMNNNLIIVRLVEEVVHDMLIAASEGEYTLSIDVQQQMLSTSKGEQIQFSIDEFYKHCLLNGLDKLSYLISNEESIAQYRQAHVDKNFIHVEN